MFAFKKSGVVGDYDCVDELDMEIYAESLPQVHEPINDLEAFKKYGAQYFTPSDLKHGLERRTSNIVNVQGIIFDLDTVRNVDELVKNFYELLTRTALEAYLWKTPSSLSSTGHENGARLYIPLGTPIVPGLLEDAVNELVILLAKADFNLFNYGVDLMASKSIGRLMGLPMQKEGTIIPWDLPERKRYNIQAEYKESEFKPTIESGFSSGFNDPTPENLASFVRGYVGKHGITFNIGERDNSLTKIFGAVKKAFENVDGEDLYTALDEIGIASTLDNPERDIMNKVKRLL